MTTVAHFPERSAINPALELFADGLIGAGARVVAHGVLPGECDRFAPWLRAHRARLDVLHLHWFQRLYLRDSLGASALALARFVAAILAAKRRGTVITWTVHNLRPHEQPFPRLDAVAGAAVSRIAHRLFVECAAAVDDLAAAYPYAAGRICIVPSGSYAGAYPAPVHMSTARRQLGLPEDVPVFLAFGLIRRYKRVPELISTFTQTFAGRDHLLLVAGEPYDDLERMRILAATNGSPNVVLRLERVSDADVPAVFGAANYSVCSYADSFNSGVLALSASYGRAAIAAPSGTARGLPPEMVVPILPGRDGLAAALRAADQRCWREAGAAAQAWAHQHTWHRCATTAVSIWAELMGSNGGTPGGQ